MTPSLSCLALGQAKNSGEHSKQLLLAMSLITPHSGLQKRG